MLGEHTNQNFGGMHKKTAGKQIRATEAVAVLDDRTSTPIIFTAFRNISNYPFSWPDLCEALYAWMLRKDVPRRTG
jgi:hypothetical protein